MRAPIPFLFLLIIAAFLHPLRAQEKDGDGAKSKVKDDTEQEVVSPSPDGKFAFLSTFSPEARSLDLIENGTKKVLRRVAESEEDSNRLTTSVLWAPDSRRFALSISTIQKRSAWVTVHFRSGGTFREIKLPELPEAVVPKRFQGDRDHFWHWAAINWQHPVRWQKDGSLVVEIETTTDGNNNFATAKRTVVIGFGKTGKAKILDSTQKVTSHIEKE